MVKPIPTPKDCMRVRMRATMINGASVIEEAVFGFWGQRFHYTGHAVDWAATVQNVAEGVRDKWNTHITDVQYWPNTVTMESVTVDHLSETDGSTLDQGKAAFTGGDAWVGTGTTSLPWETSLVVSMFGYDQGSFTPHKGRKRGRFYLPPFAANIMTTTQGQVGEAVVTDLASQIGAFLNDVQGMILEPGGEVPADYFDLVVVSRGTVGALLPPTVTQVKRIFIDSKVDVQRRRERSQDAIWNASHTIDHANPPA